MISVECSPLSHFAFPRTGKRGVPQQFPRRLYEMLDGETKNAEKDVRYTTYIAWSASGKAFRIQNVTDFSSIVLPKYFRTKKFSSFQRNLNLYGFTKVRKGADTDMYAHPFFLRDRPEELLHLQKTTQKGKQNAAMNDTPTIAVPRSVSPSFHHDVEDDIANQGSGSVALKMKTIEVSKKIVVPNNNRMTNTLTYRPTPVSPHSQRMMVASGSDSDASSTGSNDRGKLDLLAFALEHEFSSYH